MQNSILSQSLQLSDRPHPHHLTTIPYHPYHPYLSFLLPRLPYSAISARPYSPTLSFSPHIPPFRLFGSHPTNQLSLLSYLPIPSFYLMESYLSYLRSLYCSALSSNSSPNHSSP